jgi:hypothetical protein
MTETVESEEQKIGYVDTKIGDNRWRRLYAMRNSDKWLRENLSNAMMDAKTEIAIARRIESGAMGYTSAMRTYGYVTGGDDGEDRGIDIRNRYRDWYNRVSHYSPIAEQVCDRICAWELSLHKCAEELGMHRDTVKRLLIYGLNEYCIMSGWGDQANLMGHE